MSDISDDVMFVLVMVAVVAAVSIVVALLGRKLYQRYNEPENNEPATFSLHDIKKLHRDGQLTDEEFARAKALIIGQTQKNYALAEEDGESADSGSGDIDDASGDGEITFFPDDDDEADASDTGDEPESRGK